MIRKSVSWVVAAMLAVGLSANAPGAPDPNQIPAPPALTARAYLLVDHNSGRALASLNENQRASPS